MSQVRPGRGAVLLLIAAAACWGLGTVVSKHAVAEFPPITLLAVQLAASLVAQTVLMRLRGAPLRSPSSPAALGRLGLLNPGLAYALSLLGLVQITASLSVLLWAMEPLLILALASLILGERIGPVIVASSLVAVAGLAIVIYQPDGSGTLPGVALSLAGVGCCAMYTILARRWLDASGSTAPVVLAQQLHALALAAVLVAIVWALGGAVGPEHATPLGWASAIGSGILYYGLAYWLYLSALGRVPASIAASAFYLIPIVGVAGGVVLLGERLDARQWLGAAVVIVAVFAILRLRSRQEGGSAVPVV